MLKLIKKMSLLQLLGISIIVNSIICAFANVAAEDYRMVLPQLTIGMAGVFVFLSEVRIKKLEDALEAAKKASQNDEAESI